MTREKSRNRWSIEFWDCGNDTTNALGYTLTHVSISNLCLAHVCRSHLCVSHLCISHLCLSHLCLSRVCVSHLCVRCSRLRTLRTSRFCSFSSISRLLSCHIPGYLPLNPVATTTRHFAPRDACASAAAPCRSVARQRGHVSYHGAHSCTRDVCVTLQHVRSFLVHTNTWWIIMLHNIVALMHWNSWDDSSKYVS